MQKAKAMKRKRSSARIVAHPHAILPRCFYFHPPVGASAASNYQRNATWWSVEQSFFVPKLLGGFCSSSSLASVRVLHRRRTTAGPRLITVIINPPHPPHCGRLEFIWFLSSFWVILISFLCLCPLYCARPEQVPSGYVCFFFTRFHRFYRISRSDYFQIQLNDIGFHESLIASAGRRRVLPNSNEFHNKFFFQLLIVQRGPGALLGYVRHFHPFDWTDGIVIPSALRQESRQPWRRCSPRQLATWHSKSAIGCQVSLNLSIPVGFFFFLEFPIHRDWNRYRHTHAHAAKMKKKRFHSQVNCRKGWDPAEVEMSRADAIFDGLAAIVAAHCRHDRPTARPSPPHNTRAHLFLPSLTSSHLPPIPHFQRKHHANQVPENSNPPSS